MGLELTDDDAKNIGALAREVAECRRDIARLKDVIGTSPNHAVGSSGSGMCKVLAELAADNQRRKAQTAKYGAAGAAGAVVIVQVLAELLRWF